MSGVKLANQMPVRNMDLARAPRRTARKKGSGYENDPISKHPRSQARWLSNTVESIRIVKMVKQLNTIRTRSVRTVRWLYGPYEPYSS